MEMCLERFAELKRRERLASKHLFRLKTRCLIEKQEILEFPLILLLIEGPGRPLLWCLLHYPFPQMVAEDLWILSILGMTLWGLQLKLLSSGRRIVFSVTSSCQRGHVVMVDALCLVPLFVALTDYYPSQVKFVKGFCFPCRRFFGDIKVERAFECCEVQKTKQKCQR